MDETKINDLKKQAAELRASIAKLSTLEKTMGAKYLKPVLGLIEAVETL